MSAFSNLLKNYIHEKEVKIMALAQYCELERSTVYKFINGKREPMSIELVEQIAYFMKLINLRNPGKWPVWVMMLIISAKVLSIFCLIFQTDPLNLPITWRLLRLI